MGALEDFDFYRQSNTSRKGQEECTVWYDTDGIIQGIGSSPPEGFCQAVHMRCDEQGVLPELAKGQPMHALVQKVIEEVRKYRESRKKE